MSAEMYFTGGTIKAVGDGRVGGYLVVFGNRDNRDAYGEYFTADTQYNLDWYATRPVLYQHGLGEAGVTAIGVITSITPDAHGLYAEAVLDINHEDPSIREWARRAYDDVLRGSMYWSSGSMNYTVDVADDGWITCWPIAEGSLTPKPAEQSGRTAVSALREAVKHHLEVSATATAKEALPEVGVLDAAQDTRNDQPVMRSNPVDSVNMIAAMMAAFDAVDGLNDTQKLALQKAVLQALQGGQTDTPATEELPVAADMTDEEAVAVDEPQRGYDPRKQAAQLVTAMNNARNPVPARSALPAGGSADPTRPTVTDRISVRSKYDHLSLGEMAAMHEYLHNAALKTGRLSPLGVEFARALFDKAHAAYKAQSVQFESREQERSFVRIAAKANELDNTAVAMAAGNFVPDLWSNEIWRRSRIEARVAPLLTVIEMPSNQYQLPTESNDPTVYFVPETTDRGQLALDNTNNPTPDSLVGAGKTTLTAGKLGLRVGFSMELDEDSIIPIIPLFQEQAVQAITRAIDSAVLNGDTDGTANTNINLIDGTPAGNAVYRIFNGMRKQSLVTNPATSLNMNGSAPTLQAIRSLRATMRNDLDTYVTDTPNLAIIVDEYTYTRLLNIDELNVFFNNGRDATVLTGQVGTIDGMPVVVSNELQLANATGKISGTPSNNTRGQLIIAARRGWRLGFRRQITTFMEFLPMYDAYQMGANVRVALASRNTVSCAVMYNIIS
jgi:HK97 family phage major capsid protein